MKAIAAMSKTRVIGNQGYIPWTLPEDFKWFRRVTMDNILVMGRKTVDHLPKALEGRSILTVSRNGGVVKTRKDYVETIQLIEQNQQSTNPKEVFLCGGSTVYALLLPFCKELFLTRISREYIGDALMPDFEKYFVKEIDITNNVHYSIEKWTNPHAESWIKSILSIEQ